MRKKIWIIGIISIVIIAGLSAGIYYKYYSLQNNISPLSNSQPTPVAEELVTWTDPSEFSIQYPKSMEVNPHDEDKINYAHVELTTSAHPGSLIVWTKDTKASDLESWVKMEKIEQAIDSTLGGLEAKKVLINESNRRQVILTTIRDGYLYQIEVNLEEQDYWNKIFDTVATSFKFITPTDKTEIDSGVPATQETNEEVYDEEEIVE